MTKVSTWMLLPTIIWAVIIVVDIINHILTSKPYSIETSVDVLVFMVCYLIYKFHKWEEKQND